MGLRHLGGNLQTHIYADVYMEEGCGPTSVCMAVTCAVDVTLLCVLCLPGSHCPLVGLADN